MKLPYEEYNYVVSKEPLENESYLVCLISVPPFPDNNESLREIVSPRRAAVVGASRMFGQETEKSEWAFITFDRKEKTDIGGQLEKLGAELDEWFYCTQYRKNNES